jgi:beta-lactamase superfamily II metal-dependent hydrolase
VRKIRKFRKIAVSFLTAVLLLTALTAAGTVIPSKKDTAEDLEVHFFEAGAADAILLTTESSAVLIDAGEDGFGETILEYLGKKGIAQIDYLIITHFDQDHVGGAADVLEGISVGTVLQSNQPKDSDEYENYEAALNNTGIKAVTVRETYTFVLDGVSYSIDPPRQTEYDEDKSNNSSLIISVANGDNRFLFAGDAQTQRLEEFLETNSVTYDVLKMPHHGRDEPLLDALLSSVKPSLAIITSSDDEPESEAVVRSLEDLGIRVLLTREGAITLQSDGSDISFVSSS